MTLPKKRVVESDRVRHNVALRSAIALATGVATASAVQTTVAAEIEEVLVIGVRQSLETSQEIKMDADTFVDSITQSFVKHRHTTSSGVRLAARVGRNGCGVIRQAEGIGSHRLVAASTPSSSGRACGGALGPSKAIDELRGDFPQRRCRGWLRPARTRIEAIASQDGTRADGGFREVGLREDLQEDTYHIAIGDLNGDGLCYAEARNAIPD